MGTEPPVLEYARAERVGDGDRYRWWFLLAGVPALVGVFVPLWGGGLLIGDMLRTLREIGRGRPSHDSLFDIAMFTVCLAPLSAMAWRVGRLRGRRPGQVAGIIGLSVGGLHVVSVLGAQIGIAAINERAAGVVAGVALAVCGGLVWRNRKRLDLAAWILLMLVGVETALWALIGLGMLLGQGGGWPLVFVATAVVRGVEFGHVLRSRWMVGQRI